jgi:hypothetical protein
VLVNKPLRNLIFVKSGRSVGSLFMSAFRVKDTELWLRAKLEDPWAGENISALLTPDILE